MYKIIKSETTKIGRIEVTMDTIEREGQEAPFSYIRVSDWVCIIPIISDRELLILKEYRHPIRSWQHNFPCGGIDADESPEQAAVRELFEEAGYIADEVIPLGTTYPSFGISTEQAHMFVIRCHKGDSTARELLEDMENQIVTIKDFEEMIQSGEFQHAVGIVAWEKWKSIRQSIDSIS